MDGGHAVEEGRATHADAILIDCFVDGLPDFGVVGQAQIIVGAHHHHFAALSGDRVFDLNSRSGRSGDLAAIERVAFARGFVQVILLRRL